MLQFQTFNIVPLSNFLLPKYLQMVLKEKHASDNTFLCFSNVSGENVCCENKVVAQYYRGNGTKVIITTQIQELSTDAFLL